MFQDYLFYATDVQVRYLYRMLHLSSLAQHAQELHKLSPERAVVLAETLLGSMLLASVLEDEERINIRLQCGESFTVASETTRHAETRGYADFNEGTYEVKQIDAGNHPEMSLHLRSLRSHAKNGQIFEGHTLSETKTFEKVFNEHLQQSYQLFTTVKVESWIDPTDGKLRAFGVLYQELPDLQPDVAQELAQHVQALPKLSELFAQSEDPDALASKLIPHLTRPIKSLEPKWSCTCSQQTVESMILTLPAEEIMDMLVKKEPVEVKCHYCSKDYFVSPARLIDLTVENDSNSTGSSQTVTN